MANATVLKTGHLYKQGGSYRNWKRRYFILRPSSLSYYAEEGDKTPKGAIDLTQSRGIRSKEQCLLEEREWPIAATKCLAFGLAVKERTFYMYGCDEAAVDDWKMVLQKHIEEVGALNSNHDEDCPRIPESVSSKIVRGGGRMMSKTPRHTKKKTDEYDKELDDSSSACQCDPKSDHEITANGHTNDEEAIYQNNFTETFY